MDSWRASAGLLLCAIAVAVAVVSLPGSAVAAGPDISLIKANFVSAEYTTHYTVDVTGFGPTYTASWTLKLQCVEAGCPAANPPGPDVDAGCRNAGKGTDAPFNQTL